MQKQQVYCLNNLKQLLTALVMYTRTTGLLSSNSAASPSRQLGNMVHGWLSPNWEAAIIGSSKTQTICAKARWVLLGKIPRLLQMSSPIYPAYPSAPALRSVS
jgi:hypothetical protein